MNKEKLKMIGWFLLMIAIAFSVMIFGMISFAGCPGRVGC